MACDASSQEDCCPTFAHISTDICGRKSTDEGIERTYWLWITTVRVSMAGTYFEAGFEGREVYFQVGKSHEILRVVLDEGAPFILTNPDPGVYRVSGLDRKSTHL